MVGESGKCWMIYDCFPFFNELELLEIRLNELESVVDRFVLVESTRTFSGLLKPLHYRHHRRRFSAWNTRIIHVVVDDLPAGDDPWALEHRQRDGIARGLLNADAEDVILVSDVDEIPRANKILEYRDTPGVKLFQQRLCYYFLNNGTDDPWPGTRMLSYGDFRQLGGAQAVRGAPGIPVPDGGWHFSYMGGVGRIQEKLRAYAHQEYNTAHYTDPSHLTRAMESGDDLFGRDVHWRIDEEVNLPHYVREHRPRYRDWIYERSRFHEHPYDEERNRRLLDLYERVECVEGDVVVLGRSNNHTTVALANACHPAMLWAVDEWLDRSFSEEPAAYEQFLRAIRTLTLGNVQPVVMASDRFLQSHNAEIKLCHLDASRDQGRLKSRIQDVLARLVPGGILCGSARAAHHPVACGTLGELLPGCEHSGEFWWWQKPE